MCGIAGILHSDRDHPAETAIVEAMRDRLVHRGPDDAGTFVEGPVGLGHRRLSIIDLASGHQPMVSGDERFVIAYNGEIYNYQTLREELKASGSVFRTSSDTEVILEGFARWGADVVPRLNGIFALAIWDRADRRLTLARDRLGIKPLYVTESGAGVAFASEIKALFESGLVSPRLAPGAVAEYFLYRQVAGEANLFDGVRALAPGHLLEIDGNGSTTRPYWSLFDTRGPAVETSFEAAADRLDRLLTDAVERQLMSDVPLGTFCSGGIDSSLVTAMASRAAGGGINTFSVGFNEAAFNETEYARLVADQYRTTHHELRLDGDEFAAALPELIWHNDLPLHFANAVQIHAVSRLARRHVTVVLTGEGADELFGGYPRYYIPRLLAPMGWLPVSLRRALGRMLSAAPEHRLRKLGRYAGQDADSVVLGNTAVFDPLAADTGFRGTWSVDLAFRRACLSRAKGMGLDVVSTTARLDLATYLVAILNRQDKMSMAASVEARVPFLDNEVVDFALGLPLAWRQTLRHRKRILKAVARRYLPAAVVDRRKSGFGVPLAAWMRGEGALAAQVAALPSDPGLGEFFDPATLAARVDEHRAARADHSEFLWSALNFALWRRGFGV